MLLVAAIKSAKEELDEQLRGGARTSLVGGFALECERIQRRLVLLEVLLQLPDVNTSLRVA